MGKRFLFFSAVAAGMALLGVGLLLFDNGQFAQYGYLGGRSIKGERVTCAISAKEREFRHENYYTGPMIDAHLHMPVSSGIVSAVGKRIGFEEMTGFGGSLTTDYLMCLLKGEGITKTIGFFMATKFSSWQELSAVKKLEKDYSGKIAPFFMPAPYEFLRIDPADARKIIEKNKGLFKGIGEIKDFENAGLDNPHFSELYKIANDNNLVVMFHPFENHRPTVEKILKQYPKVNFLLHSGESREWITELMRDYPNVYYSLDAEIPSLYGWKPEHFRGRGPAKEEWLEYIRENFDSRLNNELDFWKTKIAAYPDRFLWGTDRWYGWHFDKEVGDLFVEFWRTFIGRLDPTVREKFAYKNAEKLLSAK